MEQDKALSWIFSSTKKPKTVKTISACTESVYSLLKAFEINIHLITQSL